MAEPVKSLSPAWRKWLGKEVFVWQRRGMISEQQAAAILALYPVESLETERGRRLVGVLSVLGAILLGVGAILFFAANWQAIGTGIKIGLIFAAIIAAYASGWWFAFEKESYPKVGQSLILLGTLFYGTGIWLIAQIFHINAHWPNGVLFWALGILPIVWVTASVPALIEASLLIILWTVFEQTEYGFMNYRYIPVALVIFALSYHLRSRVAVAIMLIGTIIWLGLTRAGINSPNILFLLVLSGLCIFSLGRIQTLKQEWDIFKKPYRFVGILVFAFFLFLLSFPTIVQYLLNWRSSPFSLSVILLMLCTAAATGYVFVLGKRQERERLLYFVEGSLLLLSLGVMIMLMITLPSISTVAFLITINVLLFIVIIAFIVIGYLDRDPFLINLGLVLFILDITTRYFDLFWATLDRSLFFMAGGLVLITGGFILERKRRKIIRGIECESI